MGRQLLATSTGGRCPRSRASGRSNCAIADAQSAKLSRWNGGISGGMGLIRICFESYGWSTYLAEARGFEPPVPVSEYNDLANRRLKPLGHASVGQSYKEGMRRYQARDRTVGSAPTTAMPQVQHNDPAGQPHSPPTVPGPVAAPGWTEYGPPRFGTRLEEPVAMPPFAGLGSGAWSCGVGHR